MPLGLRFKLFDSTVTPTVLCGMEVLPLTAAQLQRLEAVQRRMLRNIAGWVRVEDEPWDETMRRMRARLAAALRQHLVEDWSRGVCQRRWDQAWHIAHNPTSWPSRTTAWNPATFFDPAAVTMPCRGRGRPLTRWDDTLFTFSTQGLQQESWLQAATGYTLAGWRYHRDDYVRHCMA